MNEDGSGEERLTTDPATDGCPSFSGDGSLIAFTREGPGVSEIYAMWAFFALRRSGAGVVRTAGAESFD